MKSILTLILLFSTVIYSQNWIDQGATWYYDWDIPASPNTGSVKYEYQGDSIIQGHLCQRIISTDRTYFSMGGNYVFMGSQVDTFYTYVNGDTIFWYDNGEFFIYLNFDANIGSQWVVTNKVSIDGPSSCDSLSTVEVVDKGFVQINGQQLEYLELNTTANSPWGLHGIYVNRFGMLRNDLSDSNSYKYIGALFPHVNDVPCWNQSVYEWRRYRLHCYSDSTFGVYNQLGGDCESQFYLDLPSALIESNISLYPNPTNGRIELNGLGFGKYKFELLDISGKSLISGMTDGKIDIARLTSGMYLLKIFKDDSLVFDSRIIKN